MLMTKGASFRIQPEHFQPHILVQWNADCWAIVKTIRCPFVANAETRSEPRTGFADRVELPSQLQPARRQAGNPAIISGESIRAPRRCFAMCPGSAGLPL